MQILLIINNHLCGSVPVISQEWRHSGGRDKTQGQWGGLIKRWRCPPPDRVGCIIHSFGS